MVRKVLLVQSQVLNMERLLTSVKVGMWRRIGISQMPHRTFARFVIICLFLGSSALFLVSFRQYARNEKDIISALYTSPILPPLPLTTNQRLPGRGVPQRSQKDLLKKRGLENKIVAVADSAKIRGELKPSSIKSNASVHTDKQKPTNTKKTAKDLAIEYHKNTTHARHMFNCKKLIEADPPEQAKFQRWIAPFNNTSWRFPTVDETIVPAMMSDCDAFKKIRGYSTTAGSSSQQELEFPVAHSILVHRDFEHLERLVRSLYRPQNSFCIYVDAKSSAKLKKAVASYASCFDNIYLAPRTHNIHYAHVSRLLADISCMLEVLRRDKKWKYLINYAATELPLRTNAELVQILRAMHGVNDIHETFRLRHVGRFDREYRLYNGRMKAVKNSIPPPPHNITVVKGQAYNTYSRAFLEWVFRDPKPRNFLSWSKKTYSPDEHFWGTLNDLYHNPHLKSPGGFKGDPEKKGFITKFIVWTYSNAKYKCHGRSIHNICNFNALDLPTIVPRYHLAANKFDLTFDPVGYSCMEELLENRTLTPDPKFDMRKYNILYFIWSTVDDLRENIIKVV